MVAVEQAQERALGHRRRQVLQLPQAIEAQLPHAIEVRAREGSGASAMSASSDAPRSANRVSVVSVNTVASGPTSTSYSAPMPRQRLGHVDRAQRPGAFVHHVGGDAPPALPVRRIGAGAALDLQHEGHHRHAVVLDGPHVEPVREAVAHDAGKRERRVGADLRQTRPIDGASRHRHRLGARQRERLLPARHHAQHHAPIQPQIRAPPRARTLSASPPIPLEVGGEVSGIAAQHVVGVQLIGLAAETADRLQAVDEMRLGLRGRRAPSRRRSGPSAPAAAAPCR